ncbi:hypothetical protein SteCoe_26710 [Stentor coeruleus]|uniref:Uncharacterized protein n=1 Tax=Stentor coeruleus TaxID=5963 RepID=A0A1R2BC85_9CILI|nr:hypothetical protein SteCoe_26710 [Stentor coeruleus]
MDQSKLKHLSFQSELQEMRKRIEDKQGIDLELEKVLQENQDLKSALEDANRGNYFSQQISDMYKEKASVESIVEARVQEEREKNERKNSRILEILKQKDMFIEEKKRKIDELQKLVTELQDQLAHAHNIIESADSPVKELEKKVQSQAETIKALNYELRNAKMLEKNLQDMKAKRDEQDAMIKKLMEDGQRIRKREEGILNLQTKQEMVKSQQEKVLKEKDQIISELQNKVSSQSSYIEALINKFPNSSYQEILTKVLSLEAENKLLCTQLAELGKDVPSDFSNVFQTNEQMGFELSLKNREIIDLQNHVMSLQKRENTDESSKRIQEDIENSKKLSQQLEEAQFLIKNLEQSNKDLQLQLASALQGPNSESFVQNIAAQTQLVSRLNARILNLKEREEVALKKLSECEEANKELKKFMDTDRTRVGKSPKRAVKSEIMQTEAELFIENKENPWESFEKARYDRKIAELSKENVELQNKCYEIMKTAHKANARIAEIEVSHMEELAQLQKESILLSKEIENLQDLNMMHENRVKDMQTIVDNTKAEMKELAKNAEKIEYELKDRNEELEMIISELKVENSLKESCIQERTAQVAVLLESLEGNENKGELAMQVSHCKAVEGSLNRQIIELKGTVAALNQQIDQESKKAQKFQKSNETLQQANDKSTKNSEDLSKLMTNLNDKIRSLESELAQANANVKRCNENEKDLKSRIEIYINQISAMQKAHVNNIATERQAYAEEILRIQEENEPFDYEFQYNRPLIAALNSFSISIKSLSSKVDLKDIVEKLKNIVMVADKEVFIIEKKLKDLEILYKESVVFKNLDQDNLMIVEKLKEQIFSLTEELKIWRNPKNMPNPEIYSNRIKMLEKELTDRNTLITTLENELLDLKKNSEIMELRVKRLQDKTKCDEIFSLAADKQRSAKVEEEIIRKLKVRDEEIKGYLDAHLTKILLTCPDANKVLELTREISSLKLQVFDLEKKQRAETQTVEFLQKANTELLELVYESEQKEVGISITQYGPLLQQLQQKSQEAHKLKEALETRKEENCFLQQKLEEMRKELQGLKGNQSSQNFKNREIELTNEIKSLKEKQKREIQLLKVSNQELLQEKVRELEMEYEELKEKYQDGNTPGEYRAQNQQFTKTIENLLGEKTRLIEELETLRQKLKDSYVNCDKIKEELKIIKDTLSEVSVLQEVVETKPGTKQIKKLTLDKSKLSSTGRLIRALVAAKLGEADASRKLQKSAEAQMSLQKTFQTVSDSLRSLTSQHLAFQRYLKIQKVPIPEGEFSGILEANEPSSMNEHDFSELAELRMLQIQSWCEYKPLSRVLSPVQFPEEDIGSLIEGIVYLTDLLAGEEQKSNQSIEIVQRTVIRSLNKSLQALIKPTDGLASLLEYKPSDKEDRQLWYVELLEGQVQNLHECLERLIDFTQKISIEVTGNTLTAGQYRGAALDLAKSTKETSSELDIIRSLCLLIKSDLHDIKSGESTPSDYKERAYLAEAMKRKLEEEILKIRMEHSYKIADMSEAEKLLKTENEELKSAHELYENKIQDQQKQITQCVTKIAKLEIDLKSSNDKYEQLMHNNVELHEANESLAKRMERLQKEHKQRMYDAQDQMTSKDKLMMEVQKQSKILTEEKGKTVQENNALKKQLKELRNELENNKEQEKEAKELKEMRRNFEDLRFEYKKNTESHKKEIEQMLIVVSELEEKYKKMKHKYGKAKNYITTKCKNKEEDVSLLKHTFNAQILSVKNEAKDKIKEYTGQITNLQGLLKEKMEQLEEETKKRADNEEKNKGSIQSEVETQLKIAVLEEKLRNANAQHEQDVRKLSEELEKAKTDHEKLIMKLQENFTSAELLTDFIKKSEYEKQSMDTAFKAEMAVMNKKDREKDLLIDTLKKKISEYMNKSTELEQKNASVASATREIDDLKSKVSDLQNIKNQQRSRIKELESKIREMEELRQVEEQRHTTKLNEIHKEIQSSYEEFEKTTAKLEGQIESLKEQYLLDMRRQKGVKKASESMDYMFQISKRDGVISNLKKELKQKTLKLDGKKKPEIDTKEEVLILQNQVFKLKAIIKNLEHQLSYVKEEAEKLRSEIDFSLQIQDEIKEKDVSTRREIMELEKKHNAEMQTVLEEYNRLLYSRKA